MKNQNSLGSRLKKKMKKILIIDKYPSIRQLSAQELAAVKRKVSP
jgi:hypothetical protein